MTLAHPAPTPRPRRRLAAVLSFVGLAALASACGDGAARKAKADAAHVMVEEGATLLDVRTDEEFASGHLDGALHIPVQELGSRMAEVPRDRPVVVYCLSGGRSASAAGKLRAAGYEVHDLGAMSNW